MLIERIDGLQSLEERKLNINSPKLLRLFRKIFI
ncbi:hypothetical protein ZPR_1852 [Zunongwangia profunda SM-A87]|uniref:Uncharacterized protein n=1 Tax=Zunongwangia profunda (strain DSM 18752 / CCTCC AB 206139 / SM-A87) TaxID=655815 RepID=D5B992_ZUNPS|nr:hypothetical protein ZPR_1852 [Zunongwangia profunda SM-A87]